MTDPTLANLEGLQPDVRAAATFLINAYRRAGYPAIVTSGRRTMLHNAAVGGAPASQHLAGRAIDVGFLGISPAPVAWLRLGGALWVQMGGRWGGNFAKSDPIHFDDGA